MNALPLPLQAADEALLDLLRWLERQGYDFVAPTPATHARVLARDPGPASDVRDVLGWSRPFQPRAVPGELLDLLQAADALVACPDGSWRSDVRVARVRGLLFVHSAYPTDDAEAVFLGPDSYRFADFVAAELAGRSWLGRMADIGAGTGAGALTAAAGRTAARIVLTDVNARALRLARVNARHAGVAVETVEGPALDGAPGDYDLILANPPYMADEARRAYRDGGELHGGQLSLDWARAALPRLAPGGRFLLYTGAAILRGGDNPLCDGLAGVAAAAGMGFSCRELDPDVFGEELERPAYRDVERIAAVGAVFTRPRGAEAA